MPYERPALNDLAQSAENDLAARLGAFSRLRRNSIKVLARAWAGLAHGLYGYIEYFSKQLMPFTATGYFLETHAAWWGIRRKPAAYSRGHIVFSGTPGAKVEAGTLLSSLDGRKYLLTEAGRLDENGLASVAARSVGDGAEADLPAGQILRLISPLSGVKTEVKTGIGGISGGASVESDKSLRARFLDRVQEPPQGGCLHDYRQWAKAVPGVTRAWAYGNMFGPGTVGLTFVCDGADNIIPGWETAAEVQKYIDDPARKPVTADVIVFPPIAEPVDVVIKAVSPDTERIRNNVTAELAALFVRAAVPGGPVLISHIREAVSQADGEYDHVLVSPAANIVPGKTGLLILGEVTFVD